MERIIPNVETSKNAARDEPRLLDNLLFHHDLFAIDDVQPLSGFCNLTSL